MSRPLKAPVARRLLVLAPFPPGSAAAHGGGRVVAQLVQRLAARHSLALLYLQAPGEPEIEPAIAAACEVAQAVPRWAAGGHLGRGAAGLFHRVAGLLQGKPLWAQDYWEPRFARRLASLVQEWQPEIVQAEFTIMGQYWPALAGCPAPRILTVHEPGVQAVRERLHQGQAVGRLMPYLDLQAWRRFERAVLAETQAAVAFTRADLQALASLRSPAELVQIGIGADLPDQALNPQGVPPPRLLFIGNCAHPPNREAAVRLAMQIFPAVKAGCPDAQLYIVGDHPPEELRALAGQGVVVTGRVAQVTPYLDQAAVVVAPLRLGGGMRVKVLEALAAGKAVVASGLALAGLGLTPGEQAILAESDEQFSDACLRLLAHPEKRLALATAARAWALENLSWERPVLAYEELYHRVASL